MNVLIVRGNTKWTEAKDELKKKYEKKYKREYTEEKLKRAVRKSGKSFKYFPLFPMEDTISAAVERQQTYLQSESYIVRVSLVDELKNELINFRPNWIITIGNILTFLKACHLIFNKTPIFGMNVDTTGSNGTLCYGGAFPLPYLDLKLTIAGYAPKNRIKLSFSYPNGNYRVRLVLNEIFIGHSNKNQDVKIKVDSIYEQHETIVTFREMLILTPTGNTFKMDNSIKTRKSTLKVLDVYSELDEKIGARLTNFDIEKYPFKEVLKKFVIFKMDYNHETKCIETIAKEVDSLNIKIKSNNAFLVMDGFKKVVLPVNTVIRMAIDWLDSRNRESI